MNATPREFTVRTPPHFEDAFHLTSAELEQQILLMAALKMFELGKLSSGKAAELANMSRVEFFAACARYKVSVFNYPDDEVGEELGQDMETVEKLGL